LGLLRDLKQSRVPLPHFPEQRSRKRWDFAA